MTYFVKVINAMKTTYVRRLIMILVYKAYGTKTPALILTVSEVSYPSCYDASSIETNFR
jgi:hypothetical protein